MNKRIRNKKHKEWLREQIVCAIVDQFVKNALALSEQLVMSGHSIIKCTEHKDRV